MLSRNFCDLYDISLSQWSCAAKTVRWLAGIVIHAPNPVIDRKYTYHQHALLDAGHTDVMMENVYTRLESLCQGHSEASTSVGDVVAAACRLGSSRLILCDPGSKRLYMRLSLNVPVDDLSHVLKQQDSIVWLQGLDF